MRWAAACVCDCGDDDDDATSEKEFDESLHFSVVGSSAVGISEDSV